MSLTGSKKKYYSWNSIWVNSCLHLVQKKLVLFDNLNFSTLNFTLLVPAKLRCFHIQISHNKSCPSSTSNKHHLLSMSSKSCSSCHGQVKHDLPRNDKPRHVGTWMEGFMNNLNMETSPGGNEGIDQKESTHLTLKLDLSQQFYHTLEANKVPKAHCTQLLT